MRPSTLAIALTLGVMLPPPATAQTASVAITEWLVPWPNSRPRDPYVAPDGAVWFVGQREDYAARFDPDTETFTRFDLAPGTGPHNLIVDGDGMVWYAGNRAAHIGKLDPASGAIVEYPMPNPAAGDPHTLVFDGQGHIWFTVQQGNFLGRLTMATGDVELVQVPTPRARPYGIVVDDAGRPWATLFGSNMIATVDPTTMTLRQIETPNADSRIRRIVLTSDGAVWYVDYQQGALGRYDPTTGDISEWPAPSAARSRPYGMAVDDQDRIWFVETGPSPNRFVVFDTESETFMAESAIPSGGGSVRHMVYHHATQSVWFGTDTNMLGRASLP